MDHILFFTSNPGKMRTLSKVTGQYGITVEQVGIKLPEPSKLSLQEIACAKVTQAFAICNKPCIAVDGGFYIDALKGYPGPFADFTTERIGNRGYLRLMEGIAPRTCRFINSLAYLDPDISQPEYFSSSLDGALIDAERGALPKEAWSPLWQVFVPQGETKTLAEMSDDERAAWRERQYNDSTSALFARWYVRR